MKMAALFGGTPTTLDWLIGGTIWYLIGLWVSMTIVRRLLVGTCRSSGLRLRCSSVSWSG
jgi:hypothetical protein